MANTDTSLAILDNVKKVLNQTDLSWDYISFENEENVASSQYPRGTINFTDTDFEQTFGERPSYAEDVYEFKGWFRVKNQEDITRKKVTFVHTVRDALTVNALNIGALATSKLVSQVGIDDVSTESISNDVITITVTERIRYREDFVGC